MRRRVKRYYFGDSKAHQFSSTELTDMIIRTQNEARRFQGDGTTSYLRGLREFSDCVDLNDNTWRNVESVAMQLMRKPSALGELTLYSL